MIYTNVLDAVVDIMPHGYRKSIRVSQAELREAMSLFDDIALETSGVERHIQGVLDCAIFYKAAILARLAPEDLLLWIHRQFGSDEIVDYAVTHLRMRATRASREQIAAD